MTTSTRGRLTAVVAHPDDETFGCGSLLLHAAARGLSTTVVCATLGEAGEVRPGVEAPDGVAALRAAELQDAARLLGVEDVETLGFEDSGMDGEPAPQSLCGTPPDEVGDAVRATLEGHRPDIVVTLDGSDGHRDHVRMRTVVETLLAGSSTTLYLRCLPRSLMHDLVRHHADNAGAAADTEVPDLGTPDEQLTTVLDTKMHLPRREAAIALHRSQRSPFDGLPNTLRRGFLARDHLVRRNPPWDGGPVERELLGVPEVFADWAPHGPAACCWWDPFEARWACGPAAVVDATTQ